MNNCFSWNTLRDIHGEFDTVIAECARSSGTIDWRATVAAKYTIGSSATGFVHSLEIAHVALVCGIVGLLVIDMGPSISIDILA